MEEDLFKNNKCFTFRGQLFATSLENFCELDITGIEGLLFRNRLNGGEKIVLKI